MRCPKGDRRLNLTADRFIGGRDYNARLWQLVPGLMAFR